MADAKRYNVLHVIADQHHADLMGCAGHPQAITPNMDALAADGVRFVNAYAQNPICTPSRVSVLSGQYPHNHGYYGLSGPTPLALPSLFGHFRANGYRTAAFGKLHLPNESGNWLNGALDRFGDTYESPDGEIGNGAFLAYLEGAGLREWEDSWHNPWRYGERSISHDAMPSELPYEHTQEMWCAREALDFIDRGGEDAPFCIQVAFQKPHHPLLPQQRFWGWYPEDIALPETFDQDPSHRPPHFQRAWQAMRQRVWDFGAVGESFRDGARRAWRGTLACVSQIDDVLGFLLDGLRQRGLEESTIVVYHSDHGCYHGIHGIEEKAPGICSDAVCRVPMIWRVPGVTPQGRIARALAENVDLAPTLARLCGLDPMESADGEDLTPALEGSDEAGRDLALTENAWSKAIRWGRYRFVHYPEALFGEPWAELYDIEADPDETENLFFREDHRALVEACRARLFDHVVRTTRVATGQPGRHPKAGDGREANGHGPERRLREGKVNYL